jgi:hypothetical protein
MKQKLQKDDRGDRSRRWKDYVCESFCDTGAWCFGIAKRYSENTLAREHRATRRKWMRQHLLARDLAI